MKRKTRRGEEGRGRRRPRGSTIGRRQRGGGGQMKREGRGEENGEEK